MMTAEGIREIITYNKSDIAFVIGNGIHRYNNDAALSWDKLLVDLWNATQFDNISHIPNGTTYTEFYDILKMRCELIIQEWKDDEALKAELLTDKSHIAELEEIEEIIAYLDPIEFEEKIDWGNVYIPTEDEVEQQNAVWNIQNYISRRLSRLSPNLFHQTIVSYIRDINAPILTTNFDAAMAYSIIAKPKKIKERRFTKDYPWSSYFAECQLENPLAGFGIWHINGMVQYPTSIRLGLSQYMGSIARARKFIDHKNEELFASDENDAWRGQDTWLNIIFKKSLFIFGLALEENEVFLRWLLLQRASYFNKFPDKKHNGWYLIRKEDIEKSPGKRFFLESVGIKILEVEDYKTIYEDIWQ